jgi:hypothetical protein
MSFAWTVTWHKYCIKIWQLQICAQKHSLVWCRHRLMVYSSALDTEGRKRCSLLFTAHKISLTLCKKRVITRCHNTKPISQFKVSRLLVATPCETVGGYQRYGKTHSLHLEGWIWKQFVYPERQYLPTGPQGVTTKRSNIIIFKEVWI